MRPDPVDTYEPADDAPWTAYEMARSALACRLQKLVHDELLVTLSYIETLDWAEELLDELSAEGFDLSVPSSGENT